MDEKEKEIRLKLKNDFQHYARKCLKIKTKEGGIVPLELNDAQRYIHQKIEDQLKQTGRVRAIICKGRQQGSSTLVEARYFWKTTHRRGVRSMIVTHRHDATRNLFNMVSRFYDHCPQPVRPRRAVSNATELVFDLLDTSYKTVTAGGAAIGRSDTIQYLHASEVAYWPRAEDHLAGVFQAVPEGDGTEIIMESTANGIGNIFHRYWVDAEDGRSQFIPIFVPWFWQREYRMRPPEGFAITDEEAEYKRLNGLDDDQIAWRRAKIISLGGDVARFKQEYPATAAEAFETSSEGSLLRPEIVMAARKRSIAVDDDEPLIIGVDPGGDGSNADEIGIVWRKGREVTKVKKLHKLEPMQIVGVLGRIIDLDKPTKMFIDLGERGPGIVNRLHELLYKEVMGVSFGSASSTPHLHLNKRAEMGAHARDWLESEAGASIPDRDDFHAELIATKIKVSSIHTKLQLEPKIEVRKRLGKSPDLFDAFILTFAFPVSKKARKSRRLAKEKIETDYSLFG